MGWYACDQIPSVYLQDTACILIKDTEFSAEPLSGESSDEKISVMPHKAGDSLVKMFASDLDETV